MDVRMYDPTIGRFNGIDPVTHFSQGTSVAFDNNPVFWTDPSGADSQTLQGLINQMIPGIKYTTNNDGTFSGVGHTIGTKNNETVHVDTSYKIISTVLFLPEKSKDVRGTQVIETTISVTKRYYQDKKIIKQNKTLIYNTILDDDFKIVSTTLLTDKRTDIFGERGLEKTLLSPISLDNISINESKGYHLNSVNRVVLIGDKFEMSIVPLARKEFDSANQFFTKSPAPYILDKTLKHIFPYLNKIVSQIRFISPDKGRLIFREGSMIINKKTKRIKLE